MKFKDLDEVDNKIVGLLVENARYTYSEIAEIVGLSRTAVKNRIKELEEKEIISGYQANINTQKLPFTIVFTMDMEINADSYEVVKEKLKEKKETITILQTTGKYNLMAICVAGSADEMRNFINKISKEIAGIVMLKYNVVLDVVKGSVVQGI